VLYIVLALRFNSKFRFELLSLTFATQFGSYGFPYTNLRFLEFNHLGIRFSICLWYWVRSVWHGGGGVGVEGGADLATTRNYLTCDAFSATFSENITKITTSTTYFCFSSRMCTDGY
jgi:hypothetical protein